MKEIGPRGRRDSQEPLSTTKSRLTELKVSAILFPGAARDTGNRRRHMGTTVHQGTQNKL